MESNVSEEDSHTEFSGVDYYDRNIFDLPSGEYDTIYYGVHVPSDTPIHDGIQNFVFTDKVEALKLVKKCKKARFKAFYYYHEAVEFAEQGAEFPNNNLSVSSLENIIRYFEQANILCSENFFLHKFIVRIY